MGLSRFGGIGNGLGIVVALILDEVDFRVLTVWAKNVVQRPSNPLAPGNRHIPLTAMISAVDSLQWRWSRGVFAATSAYFPRRRAWLAAFWGLN